MASYKSFSSSVNKVRFLTEETDAEISDMDDGFGEGRAESEDIMANTESIVYSASV